MSNEIVRAALGAEQNYSYLVRQSGSFVEGPDTLAKTLALLHGLDWTKHKWDTLPEGAGIPIAFYYRAMLPAETTAFCNAISVAEALKRGLSLEVRVQEGKVNPNCTVNPRALGVFSLDGTDPTPTREVWIILGPSEDKLVVWTWHPGPPSTPVNTSMYAALDAVTAGADATDPEVWGNALTATVHLPHAGA